MKKTICFLAMLSLAGLYAQPQQKIAVLDIKAKAGIDPMTVSSLTDYTCTVIADMGKYDVIGKDDMQAMLEHIADKQLLECDDTKCLAQIGGALGVELLMAGNIGMVGKMYLINFKLINIEEAQVQNRVSVQYVGDETGLVAKVKESVDQLFGLAAETAPATETAAPEESVPDKEVSVEKATATSPAPVPVRRSKRPARAAAAPGRKWRLVVQPGAHFNFYTEGIGFSQQLGLQFGRLYTGMHLILNDHSYDDSEPDGTYIDIFDAEFDGLAAVVLYRINRHPAIGFHIGGFAGFYEGYYQYEYDDMWNMVSEMEDHEYEVYGGFKFKLDVGGRRLRAALESTILLGPEDNFDYMTYMWESGFYVSAQIDLGLMLVF